MLELMVAVAVAAILIGVGVPSYQRFIATQRIKTAVSDLNYTLVFARSEAIKRNTTVVVRPAGNCWSAGWSVQTVNPADATSTLTLTRQDAYRDISIRTSTSPSGTITFNSEGRIQGNATPFQMSSVTATGAPTRCVALDLSGMPSTQLAACRTAVVACS